MPSMTMIQAINQGLRTAMQQDSCVVMLGEDVGKNGGVFRATDGLQAEFGENRVFDTPLAESGIVGASVGLAVNGMKPVAEIQFLGFIYETMDQIASQAARLRFRSQGRYHVPMVIRAPFGGGVRTPELHADSLEALFLHTPGLKVVMPSTPYDAKGLLLAAIQDPDPVLFLEPMNLYRAWREEVPEAYYEVPIGQAKIVHKGDDITLVAWGPTVPMALEAAQQMQEHHKVSCEVIDLRTIAPMDTETVLTSVQRTGRAVIIHEAVKHGGAGAEVISQIQEHAFLSMQAPVLRVTGYDTPYPAPSIEDFWLPSVARIMDAVHKTVSY